jgi:hypothetical protein
MTYHTSSTKLFQEHSEPAEGGGGGAGVVVDHREVSASTGESAFSADGKLGKNWWAKLGDEFAPHAARAATFKDVGGLFKSYIHSLASKPSLPGENASEDDVAAWRTIAGVPTDPKDYGLTAPEEMPQDLEFNEAAVARVAAVAHKHHVSATAMKALLNEQIAIAGERAAEYREMAEAQKRDAEDQLIREWKGDFEANKSTVRHLAGRLAESAGIQDGPELQQLANNPAFARMLLQASKLFGEDSTRSPLGYGDMRSSQQRADAIMSGKDAQWSDRYKRGEMAALELVSDLLRKAQD